MDDEAAEKAWERYYEFAPLMPGERAAYMAGARWAREEALREAAAAVESVLSEPTVIALVMVRGLAERER